MEGEQFLVTLLSFAFFLLLALYHLIYVCVYENYITNAQLTQMISDAIPFHAASM